MPTCLPQEVSGEVAGGEVRVPHVQQAHRRAPRAAPEHRDTAGRAGVTPGNTSPPTHPPPPSGENSARDMMK